MSKINSHYEMLNKHEIAVNFITLKNLDFQEKSIPQKKLSFLKEIQGNSTEVVRNRPERLQMSRIPPQKYLTLIYDPFINKKISLIKMGVFY